VVLSVSRLSPEKDIPTLLDAFARLHQARPHSRLLLAGDGPDRARLQALVAQHGLQAVVQLPGRVAQPMAWMARADVFVLASQYEGFGNVLVEALASGVPVVSTDCPVGPREILQDGRYGRLVPVGDVAALALAMGQALDQGAQPAGAQAHAQQFTEARACAAYRALFDSLLNKAPAC
jgi:glycosyltransferase involved in cell wall biosynthesis